MVGAAILLLLIDLLPVDSTYLNKTPYGEDPWKESEENKQELVMGKADQQILRDTGWYRVLNLSVSPFQDATTSFFHKSIGGYHAAKISRYQDLAEQGSKFDTEMSSLNGDTAAFMNLGLNQTKFTALNMLGTKYIILDNNQGRILINPNALGPCWFVKEVRFANTLQDEMKALNGLDASKVAIVSANQKSKITQPVYDSTTKIIKVSNGDDHNILTYLSSAATIQFAVFSEVYYSEGWFAYIDGKKVDYLKTNYTLRGMNVPAGNHTIEFKFEPPSYKKGRTFTSFGQVIVLILLITGIVVEIRNRRKEA